MYLDEAGDFDKLCNMAMVELEPIPREDETLEATAHQGGDLEMHGLVQYHVRYDSSRCAPFETFDSKS